jgi:hypothetical protein
VTNIEVSTVVARSAVEVEPRRPTVRWRISETLDSGDAGACVLGVQVEGPAAAASQMISSHQRSVRSA